jgi:hypothetical protein
MGCDDREPMREGIRLSRLVFGLFMRGCSG